MRSLNFNDGFTSETPSSTNTLPASDVTNTPSGNLSATNQQDVNNELQNDIDTRALSSDMTTALALRLRVDTAAQGLNGTQKTNAKTNIDLHNVDNTSDVNKPVSTLQAAADATVLSSAQTYTNNAIANLIASSPATLDTLDELAAALGDDPNFATTMATSLGNRLRVDTAAQGLNGTQKTNAKTNIDLQNVDNTSDATKNAAAVQLTNKDIDGGTASNTSRITLPKAAKSTLDGLTRKQGTLVFDTTSNKPWYDDGTNLKVVGSGSGGTKNYIEGGDAESGTTGWATYADAAGTSPVDGTGGSPSATWTTSNSSPLADSNSFLLTKAASNRQGDGASFDFTIDAKDKAKVLNITFDYLVSSGTFVAGTSSTNSDVTVWIYDVTNGVLIQPSSYKLLSNGSTIADRFSSTFQTASNSTSYRLILHIGSTSASAYTLKIDNINVSASQYVYGTPITDWQSYTPTFTGFGTVTSVLFRWRRVGDSVDIVGSWTNGTVSGAQTPTFTLPNNLTAADSTKIPTMGYYGDWIRLNATASTRKRGKIAAQTNLTVCELFSDDYTAAVSPGSSVFGSTIASNSEAMRITVAGLPIAGWSSSVQMSEQMDTRVVAASATGNPASATSGNPIIFGTSIYDTHGAYNTTTGRYTIPVSGYYKMSGFLLSTGVSATLYLYVDAVQSTEAGTLFTSATGNNFTVSRFFNAGQVIDLRPNGTVDASGGNILFERISGPNQIAASELVACRVYAAANLTGVNPNNSSVKIALDTKDFDSHGAFDTSTKRFTAPVSGTYDIDANLFMQSTNVLANNYICGVYKNGTIASWVALETPDATTQFGLCGSVKLKLNAGDYIEVYLFGTGNNSASTITVTGGTAFSTLAIARIGY